MDKDVDLKLYHIEKDGLSGFMDGSGRIVVEPVFEHLLHGSFSDGLCPFVSENKCGFLKVNGEIAITPCYDDTHGFSEGFAAVCDENGRWGFIDTAGDLVIPYRYDDVCGFAEDGLAAVELDGKWGYIDKAGAVVITPEYDIAFDFDGLLAKVGREEEEFYIDRNGNRIWPCFD